MNKQFFGLLLAAGISATSQAETLNLEQAIDKAIATDPRIGEKQAFVERARAQLQEAEGSDDLFITANAFVGISPGLDGGFFENDNCDPANECVSRDDRYTLDDGLSPWFNLQYGVVKPLHTFGKIENYSDAAKQNIQVKQQDVRLQRGSTILDVKRAYYGHLTAKNTRLFLEDIKKRVDNSLETVQIWLEEDEGLATQSDKFALQSASALAQSYIVKAVALEKISLDGLKVLSGYAANETINLADEGVKPVPLPDVQLQEVQKKALAERPEMKQLEHGLQARRSLVKANQAMKKPNLYAAVVGMASYSPMRDRLDNPHIYDPFNDVGTTPMVGMHWEWAGGVQNAKTKQAQAELNALVERNAFAQKGIPFQVAESYAQVHAHYEALKSLEKSARSARKWMIASYTDFEAGLIPVDKIVSAFQAYVLSYTDYLKTVYDYNMQVAQLEQVSGAYQ